MAAAVAQAEGIVVVLLDNLIRRRITRHFHDAVAVLIREEQPGAAEVVPQGVLLAPGGRVARVHVEVEVAPLRVVCDMG